MLLRKLKFDEQFDLALATCKGQRFEQWFADLAAAVWGDDFERIKPGSRRGDKKSDGRHIPSETIFQCYAPESPSDFARNAPGKMRDSFPEVLDHWPNIKKWVFVHNNIDGLPPKAHGQLEDLRKQYPTIKFRAPMPKRFLKDGFHDKLTVTQILSIYPSAKIDFNDVTLSDVKPLLRKIITQRGDFHSENLFGQIPNKDKMEFNKLSPEAKNFIHHARFRSDIIRCYLDETSNPRIASSIQGKMKRKYEELKLITHDSDEILGFLIEYIGGDRNPKFYAAAYVIIAYYFDACDIFDNAPRSLKC